MSAARSRIAAFLEARRRRTARGRHEARGRHDVVAPVEHLRGAPDPAADTPAADGWDRRVGPKPGARIRRAGSTCHAGYRTAPPAERSAFWMLCSFATTVAASRAINYVRERRRSMPRTRGAARTIAGLSNSRRVRVHHFMPGIGLGFLAGGAGLISHPGPPARWLSPLFGTGVALTTDELRLLAGRNDPYWGSQGFALAQCAAAAIGATGLAARFHRRGRRNPSAIFIPSGGYGGRGG